MISSSTFAAISVFASSRVAVSRKIFKLVFWVAYRWFQIRRRTVLPAVLCKKCF